MHKPAKGDWNKLYQAVKKFHNAAPWTWMEDEDLFAVENPANGEPGYCSILGHGREEFGLSIFLGEQGYARYLEIISTEAGPEDDDEMMITPALLLLFVSRPDLQKEDLDVIRSLDLKFRGRNAWPLFRSLRPGYAPWFLEKEEAVFFTAALEQALIVADKVRLDGLDLYEKVDEKMVFTRYYRDGEWREEWRSPTVPSRSIFGQPEDVSAVDEAELLLLRNSAGELSGSWEMDMFILPTAIGEPSQRPYFPLCILAVDRSSGLVINTVAVEPWLTVLQQREQVLQILKKARPLPRNILVKNEKIKAVLEPLTRSSGIELQVGPLPLLEEVQDSLRDHFMKHGP